jgi:hypothetical protein
LSTGIPRLFRILQLGSAFFQKNWLIGLLDLNALGIVCLLVLIPTLVALLFALWKTNSSLVAFRTILFFIGFLVNLASHPAFPMLTFSGHYIHATSPGHQAVYFTTGTTMLSVFESTTWGLSFII